MPNVPASQVCKVFLVSGCVQFYFLDITRSILFSILYWIIYFWSENTLLSNDWQFAKMAKYCSMMSKDVTNRDCLIVQRHVYNRITYCCAQAAPILHTICCTLKGLTHLLLANRMRWELNYVVAMVYVSVQ